MSVTLELEYLGALRCRALHAPSRAALDTDAPRDNAGRGESFSPTDLVGAALGACMLTTMAIAAAKLGASLEGASATVLKKMIADPKRRIESLPVELRMPGGVSGSTRVELERVARECPVALSLSDRLRIDATFLWDDACDTGGAGERRGE